MVRVPLPASPTILLPPATLALTCAVTPDSSDLALMAATLEIEEAAALAKDSLSLTGVETSIAVPLITKSPLPRAKSVPTAEIPDAAPTPKNSEVEFATLNSIRSPAFAPTWKAPAKEPSSNFRPLKLVSSPIRVISAITCLASACSAARSPSELVELADCTASSRIR